MSVDLSNDFLLLDFLENITYSPRVDDDTFAPSVTMVALKRADKKSYTDIDLELAEQNVIWYCWTKGMSDQSIVPKRADKFLTSNNVTWIVERVIVDDRTMKFTLECYKELNETVEGLEGFMLLETGGGMEFR